MRSKLAGHAMELLGFALIFLGLGLATAVLFISGKHPEVPFWQFVVGALVVGVPTMIAGGRINSRGRGRVLGMSPESAAREYHEGNVLLAFYLGFVMLHGLFIAWPMFVCATGLLHPRDPFVRGWIVATMLILCAGRNWISRPLWLKIERRVRTRWKMPPNPEATGPETRSGGDARPWLGSGTPQRPARVEKEQTGR